MSEEAPNKEVLNMSIRKFLKVIGVNSQREIENAVAQMLKKDAQKTKGPFAAKMHLRIPELDLDVSFDGEIRLEEDSSAS